MSTDVRALVIDPKSAPMLYAGTGNGMLQRSDDGGDRWELLPALPVPGWFNPSFRLAASIRSALSARRR